jgi:prephenate dehydratase
VLCIKKFATAFNLSFIESYRYLENYGGLQFILDHYEIEHTLSINDAVEDLQAICRKNGGLI